MQTAYVLILKLVLKLVFHFLRSGGFLCLIASAIINLTTEGFFFFFIHSALNTVLLTEVVAVESSISFNLRRMLTCPYNVHVP